ncbi:MAG: hypothetical protein EPO02_02275 [Nitrospirae bacterium]|nr:MAG: hypothetical protein EPO02_02275 [Nitrospirota bacterium]
MPMPANPVRPWFLFNQPVAAVPSLLPGRGFQEESVMLFNEVQVFLGLVLWGLLVWMCADKML